MRANGITGAVADDIYTKIKAFAAFGFAESHSISFAFLVYASSWLKLYYPAAFCAALLNAQPMGFYSPADRWCTTPSGTGSPSAARTSTPRWPRPACRRPAPTLTGTSPSYAGPGPAPAGGPAGAVQRPDDQRRAGPSGSSPSGSTAHFTSLTELARRVGLNTTQLEALATAGAFDCLGIQPARGALGGRRGRRLPARPARPARAQRAADPAAAGDDRAGAADGRPVGHRHHPGPLSRPP